MAEGGSRKLSLTEDREAIEVERGPAAFIK
jgi:hypothetical protein